MTISMIAAMANNRVIGRGNTIPWYLPADTAYFRQTTLGHPVIMGSKTFASIGRPLSGRVNIVLSKNKDLRIPGCVITRSLTIAIEEAEKTGDGECFVIGGGAVYAEALPLAHRLYLTEIDAEIEGDTFFPEFDKDEWREVSRERHSADEQNVYAMDFVVYERVPRT